MNFGTDVLSAMFVSQDEKVCGGLDGFGCPGTSEVAGTQDFDNLAVMKSQKFPWIGGST